MKQSIKKNLSKIWTPKAKNYCKIRIHRIYSMILIIFIRYCLPYPYHSPFSPSPLIVSKKIFEQSEGNVGRYQLFEKMN